MLEEHLVPYVHELRRQIHPRNLIQDSQYAAKDFLFYVSGASRKGPVSPVDLVEEFVQLRGSLSKHVLHREPSASYFNALRLSVRRFLRYLGLWNAKPGRRRSAELGEEFPLSGVIQVFRQYLIETKGLRSNTVGAYVDEAIRLGRAMGREGVKTWDELTPRFFYEYLRSEARRMGNVSFRIKQVALRCLFRFLKMTGRCSKDLSAWLIRYRRYRFSHVPAGIHVDDLYRLFETFKANRPIDIRDRAAFLLLTWYGLRTKEITQLSLDDIRWGENQLVLRNRKAGRDLHLPLVPLISQALRSYIDDVRPRGVNHRNVFTKRGGGPYPHNHLGSTLKYRLRKLGLSTRLHSFRHALATRLLNNNCPPEWIQQMLGHASFESTRIYAKADLTHLREVADVELMIDDEQTSRTD